MHNQTLMDLHYWYQHVFDKFGWIILCMNENDTDSQDKIKYYVRAISHLKKSLEMKISQVQETDRKNDLQIMYDNLSVLYNYIKNTMNISDQMGGKKYLFKKK